MEIESFEDFWANIKAFADEHRMSYTHVEEEFIIDGIFIPVPLMYENDYAFDFENRIEED